MLQCIYVCLSMFDFWLNNVDVDSYLCIIMCCIQNNDSNKLQNYCKTHQVSLVKKILLCLLFAVWSGNTMWKSSEVCNALCLMKIDNKVECNDDENEDECDQTTFVWLKELTKLSVVWKTSKNCEALNHVVVVCYKLKKCIMYALRLHVFNHLNV